MEVTRENFKAVLADLPLIFKNAQFIAFDTEFTGLKVEGASNINYFDTLEDLYLKDRLKAETFMAIQFGIVVFFYDEAKNKYTHQGFNFYVYPSSSSDVNFTCQNKSIDFLVQHGFDFNKLFRTGIPYLKDAECEKLLEKLDEKFERNYQLENSIKMDVAPEHKTIIDDIYKKIEEILQSNSKESFNTERYNSFIRKLIYSSVQNKFGSEVFLESNKDETMTILVGFSEEELEKRKREKYLIKKNEILDEVGFSKVIKLIMDSGKLLIGHNLFLDLLFTIKQFLTPLPNSYSEFKELVKFTFPKILDTKFMASSMDLKNLKDTSLYNLAEHFCNLNEIPEVEMIEIGKGYKIGDKKLHEAAYDAYLTGLCFLSMSKQLGLLNCTSNIFKTLPQSPLLSKFLNKLSTPKLHDIHHMNIGGTDNEPDRTGVYYLTFPKEWTRENIMTLFKEYGFINISWINSTSAFIKVKKEFVKGIEKNLKTSDSSYKLYTHSEYRETRLTTDLLLSPLMEKRLGNNFEYSKSDNDSPFKIRTSEGVKRKKLDEDIGEVVERSKKQCIN